MLSFPAAVESMFRVAFWVLGTKESKTPDQLSKDHQSEDRKFLGFFLGFPQATIFEWNCGKGWLAKKGKRPTDGSCSSTRLKSNEFMMHFQAAKTASKDKNLNKFCFLPVFFWHILMGTAVPKRTKVNKIIWNGGSCAHVGAHVCCNETQVCV